MAASTSTEATLAGVRRAERLWRSRQIIRFGFLQYLSANPPAIVLATIWPRLIFQTVFWVMLGYVAAGSDGATFAYVGAIATALTYGGIAGMSDVPVDDKFAGTYTRLLVGATPPTPVFFGRGVAQLTASVVEMLVCLVAAGLVTGQWRTMLALIPLLPIYVVIALSMSAAGLACASFCVGKRAEVAIYNGLTYLVILCCGALIPPGTLAALDVIGVVLPVSHGLVAVRSALDGGPWLAQVLLEVLVGLGWIALAYVLFQVQAARSRRTGSDSFS